LIGRTAAAEAEMTLNPIDRAVFTELMTAYACKMIASFYFLNGVPAFGASFVIEFLF
jgi:hypothetical protein